MLPSAWKLYEDLGNIMSVFLEIIFWVSLFGILHSYFFYPLLLSLLSRGKKPNSLQFSKDEEFPFVSVIISVYNEERVIAEKLESLKNLDYPRHKLMIFVGSDCSTDRTNEIVGSFIKKIPFLNFSSFSKRRGKPGVINELADIAFVHRPASPDHIFLITDANVILKKQTLKQLTKHFKNEKIVEVDANMIHTGMRSSGISKAEDHYITSEVKIKYLEGMLWGKMIGPFGGCYAIRSTHFSKVPPTFLVDDFYITMKVFERGGLAINELEAVCIEAVSHDLKEEYRRKSRISAGNFQNLVTFVHLWWPPFRTLNFAFFSHKVLRWFGPFFLILIFISGGSLALSGNLFYKLLFVFLSGSMMLASIADYLLIGLNVNILPFRKVRYFLLMNLALLEGFFKFLKGIHNNVWEPPKRN